MRNDILGKRELIEQWIKENKSKGFICRELKCKQITLDSYLKKFGIEYKGNKYRIGYEINRHLRKTSDEYVKTSTNIKSSRLRIRLIRDGIKKDECEDCGLVNWRYQKLKLELHHIDGDHHNNDLTNLKILCPNCHSLIPNHRKIN
jgi:Zn finger protein HypA/HybF involved in hydrogenase expression